MKMKSTLITASIGMALLFVSSTGSSSELFRCIDDNGQIVYSDRVCAPAGQRQTVKITDNSMDNSNLKRTIAIQTSTGVRTPGGASVAVIKNDGPSSSSASKPTRSQPQRQRSMRRSCGG